jgi:DHA1 family bicyclomycin/chloramphenicol resistance-like MFS transporter
MALPALGDIGASLHTSANIAGLTLSLFMLGFSISPLVYGPLADRYGRRPCLIAGLLLFMIGAIGATFANSITMLLCARLVQGAGAGAGMTLAFAIIRDLFEGPAAQSRLAIITVVANLAPIVAPAAGTALLAHLGWRGIYGVTLACGLVLVLVVWISFAETLQRNAGGSNAVSASSDSPIVIYKRLLSHRSVRKHILVNGLGFAWMFAYVAGSPLTLLGVLHVSPVIYASMFACTGAGIVAGASLNGRLARHGFSAEGLLMTAIGLGLLAALLLIALTLKGHVTLIEIMPLLVLATFSFGLAAPSAAHGALDPIPELAGAAGGCLTAVQMVCGAIASSIVALLFARFGIMAMAGTMAAAALLAAIVYLPLYREVKTGTPARMTGH